MIETTGEGKSAVATPDGKSRKKKKKKLSELQLQSFVKYGTLTAAMFARVASLPFQDGEFVYKMNISTLNWIASREKSSVGI